MNLWAYLLILSHLFSLLRCHYERRRRNSFLWRIDSDPPSYFFGTIHVPYTRVWDYIPENTKEAFRKSDMVYFELDLTNSKTLSLLSACQLLPRGLHLSQVIPSDLFIRLKIHLDYVRKVMPSWITRDQLEKGIYSDYLFSAITGNWERKQPIWITLMINSLTKSDVASRGFPVLDLYLSKLASKQRKAIGAIEKVDEQCRPLNLLNSTQVIFALNQTLLRQEELRAGGGGGKRRNSADSYTTTDDLINSYRNGNLDEVIFNQDTFLPSLPPAESRLSPEEKKMAREIDKFFQENMIDRRNKRMAARVIDLLVNKPGKSYFFAFGAGHFMGNHSILDYVQSAGFPIDHVRPGQSLESFKFRSGGRNDRPRGSSKTVEGTFDDLSENEKTRALLQFLQYHQQLEQEDETRRFQELLKQRGVTDFTERPTKDERTVQESLRIWYGLETDRDIVVRSSTAAGLDSSSTILLLIFISVFLYY